MTNVPATRGPFAFGAPYHTTGVRLTTADDGMIWPRTYPYWANVSVHDGPAKVFLGTDRGPQWWEVSPAGEVTPHGPIPFPIASLRASTAEGWYWDPVYHDVLYCSDDTHLYRYHFDTQQLETVVDITPLDWRAQFALRQWHSSDGGRHSATVKQVVADGPWPNIGTVVYTEGATHCQPWQWFPVQAGATLDEAQVDRAGMWLLIKETPAGAAGEDNRIVRLDEGSEYRITDAQGAGGHSDSGFGYMVAADNQQAKATWRVWEFGSADVGRVVLETPWEAQVIHVSHCNARPAPSTGQWVLGSGTVPDLLVIPLDGSTPRAVAPSMAAGTDYDHLPKANVDRTGRWALWTAYVDGRFDAFMVALAPAPACTHSCPVHCPPP
jgi:hypothetical protein